MMQKTVSGSRSGDQFTILQPPRNVSGIDLKMIRAVCSTKCLRWATFTSTKTPIHETDRKHCYAIRSKASFEVEPQLNNDELILRKEHACSAHLRLHSIRLQ